MELAAGHGAPQPVTAGPQAPPHDIRTHGHLVITSLLSPRYVANGGLSHETRSWLAIPRYCKSYARWRTDNQGRFDICMRCMSCCSCKTTLSLTRSIRCELIWLGRWQGTVGEGPHGRTLGQDILSPPGAHDAHSPPEQGSPVPIRIMIVHSRNACESQLAILAITHATERAWSRAPRDPPLLSPPLGERRWPTRTSSVRGLHVLERHCYDH